LSGPPDMKTFESFKASADKIGYMAKVAKAYPDSLVDFVDKALDDADPEFVEPRWKCSRIRAFIVRILSLLLSKQ